MKIYFFIVLITFYFTATAQNSQDKLIDKPANIIGVIKNTNKENQNTKLLFKLCGNASFMTPDLLSDYITMNFCNKSSNELYHNVYMIVNKMYINPKESINSVKNSLIQVDGYKESISYFDGRKINISYRLEFEFKDNKIKIKAPFITDIWDNNIKFHSASDYIKSVIWGSSTISDIELHINKILNFIILETSYPDNW